MTEPEDWDEEQEYGEPEEMDDDEDAIPVCPNCLAPYNPLQHYCSDCYEAVGQYTPYIPFVNIRFETRFGRELWKRMVADNAPLLKSAFYLLLILVLQPAILIGVPFSVWDWLHRKPPEETD